MNEKKRKPVRKVTIGLVYLASINRFMNQLLAKHLYAIV
jgi:hypothetical protein